MGSSADLLFPSFHFLVTTTRQPTDGLDVRALAGPASFNRRALSTATTLSYTPR
jgi:hypothetical protein